MILPIAYGVSVLLGVYLIFNATALLFLKNVPAACAYYLLLVAIIVGLFLMPGSVWFLVSAVVATLIVIILDKVVI